MSNIEKHLQQKAEKLSTLESAIKQIQEQLNSITQELRVEAQLAKAQQQISGEWNTEKSKVKKLLRDACSCFDVTALDDFAQDVLEIVEEVKTDYQDYAQSDRFLNAETSAIEDDETDIQPSSQPLIMGVLPNDNDDTTQLTSYQLLQYFNKDELDADDLAKLQSILNIPGRIKKPENVAAAIAKTTITRFKLYNIVQLIKATKVDSSSNGHNSTPELMGV
jgi:DNA repair exonuclease SbcCD ATPase subunit